MRRVSSPFVNHLRCGEDQKPSINHSLGHQLSAQLRADDREPPSHRRGRLTVVRDLLNNLVTTPAGQKHDTPIPRGRRRGPVGRSNILGKHSLGQEKSAFSE